MRNWTWKLKVEVWVICICEIHMKVLANECGVLSRHSGFRRKYCICSANKNWERWLKWGFFFFLCRHGCIQHPIYHILAVQSHILIYPSKHKWKMWSLIFVADLRLQRAFVFWQDKTPHPAAPFFFFFLFLLRMVCSWEIHHLRLVV